MSTIPALLGVLILFVWGCYRRLGDILESTGHVERQLTAIEQAAQNLQDRVNPE